MARRRGGTTAAQLLAWLEALPEFEERETWGHPTFRVRGRMFGTLDAEGTRTTLKAAPEEQQALIADDPETYSYPAYVGKHGWVSVELARADPEQVHELAVEAWRRTAPKRVVKAWDAAAL
jgi:hypothetical protein